MNMQKATNVTWHSHIVKREDRELLLKQLVREVDNERS